MTFLMRYFIDGSQSCLKEHQEEFESLSQFVVPRIGERLVLPDYTDNKIRERFYRVDMVTYNPPYDGTYLTMIDIECTDITKDVFAECKIVEGGADG